MLLGFDWTDFLSLDTQDVERGQLRCILKTGLCLPFHSMFTFDGSMSAARHPLRCVLLVIISSVTILGVLTVIHRYDLNYQFQSKLVEFHSNLFQGRLIVIILHWNCCYPKQGHRLINVPAWGLDAVLKYKRGFWDNSMARELDSGSKHFGFKS